jgi:AraC-like DNA-binding protein
VADPAEQCLGERPADQHDQEAGDAPGADRPRCDLWLHELRRYERGPALREHAVTLDERVAAAGAGSRRVREHIVARLQLGPPTAEATSRALGISRQTLYRRLRAEGTSFEQLLDTTRHRRALEHLGDPRCTLHEIATLLGFADYSSFHRAVRRWTGQSPRAYRRGMS